MLSNDAVQAIRDRANVKVEKAWNAQQRFRAKQRQPFNGGEIASRFPIFWMCWQSQCRMAYQGKA
jgi:hypothetical protein